MTNHSTKTKESAQVQKFRRKLQKQLEKEHAKMSDAALKKVKETLLIKLSLQRDSRINLRDKTFSLFDENRHSAPIESDFIQNLFSELRKPAKKDSEHPQKQS